MKKDKKPGEGKSLSLKLIGKEDVVPEAVSPAAEADANSSVTNPPTDSIGVTVAAFMLNAESQSSEIGFGSGNSNTEAVRNEILKAIREEGENF
jgi:hypothetical protein